MSLTDKVTIISGATGGLGQVVSQIFFEGGAKVVLVGSRQQGLKALVDDLGAGDRILPVVANLADPGEAQTVVDTTLSRFGQVDILLNLAGGFSGGKPVSEGQVEELQKMLAINLYTAYNLSRAAVRPMLAQNWGRIVNVGSRDALHGRANFSAYSISKAAVLRLTEAMAEEVKGHNIAVNAIIPGAIDTDANRQATPHADTRKWIKPTTIAATLLFLVQEKMAINGAAIPLYEEV